MAGSAALAAASDAQGAELRAWRELTGRVDVLTWLAARGDGEPTPELAAAEAALAALEAKLAAENPRWLDAVAPPAAALGADEVRARAAGGHAADRAPARGRRGARMGRHAATAR